MTLIMPKEIRKQNKMIAKAINDLFDEVGRSNSFVFFTSYIGNIYKLEAYNPSLVKVIEIRLDYKPFEVNWSSSQKKIKELTGVSSIIHEGSGYKFIP